MGVEELKLGKQTPWWHNFGSQLLRCVFSAKTRLCGSWFFGVAHNFIGHSEDSLKCYEHGVPSKHERKNFRKQKTRLAPRSFRTLCLWWGVERRIFWMNTLWSVNWKMSLAFTQPLWLGEEQSPTDFHCAMGLWRAMAMILLVLRQCSKEDAPAHPGEIVTVRSLCEAFATSKLTKAGTMWIDVIEKMQS